VKVEIFSRAEELDLLQKRFASRKSTLVHGPSGVGKTLLLKQVMPGFPDVLYCPVSSSPQAVFRHIAELLIAKQDSTVVGSCGGRLDILLGKSSVSLKGVMSKALRAGQYLIVLDHLHRSSPALASMMGEVMVFCSTPVIAVARSAHMEDAGYISPLLPDRSERLAIHNFDSDTAKAFALQLCSQQQLEAANLPGVIDSMVKSSEGNPGAIMRLIAMAKLSKYRSDDHIKWSPLYIDFLMEWAAANAV
jgi:ATP/maltotriose-dependent transcriptional regulator MalT